MRPRRAGKPIFCRVDFSTNGLEDFVDLLGRVVVRRVVRQIADEPNLLENVRHAAFRYGTELVGLAVSCHGLFLLDGRGDGHDAPLALASTASGASRAEPIGAASFLPERVPFAVAKLLLPSTKRDGFSFCCHDRCLRPWR